MGGGETKLAAFKALFQLSSSPEDTCPICSLLRWTIKFPLFSGIHGFSFGTLTEESLLKATGCNSIRNES